MDLILTAFCVITLVVIFFSGCDDTSKEEELLDTLLLVARNVVQFGRLASVMRQYVLGIFVFASKPDLNEIDLASQYSLVRSLLTCHADEHSRSTSTWKAKTLQTSLADHSFAMTLSSMSQKSQDPLQ